MIGDEEVEVCELTEYLYRRYAKRLYVTAAMLLPPAFESLLYDLVHDVFTTFYAAAQRGDIECLREGASSDSEIKRSCRNYLLTALRNRCRQETRARFWNQKPPLREEVVCQCGPSEQACEMDDDADIVRNALKQLPQFQRRILILRDVIGLMYEEIAEELEIPLGTVRSRLFRARRKLRRQLAGHFCPK